VAVLAASLVAGGLVDHSARPAARSAASAAVQPFPAAAPVSAISSSWFCAGATDRPNGAAPGSVVLANNGRLAASGVISLVTARGVQARVPVSIAPAARAVVREAVPHGAAWVGAIVDIDAGAVAVQQQIDGDLGRAASPCATAGSSQWYFTSGATLVNASVYISLLNPYPTDAVVNMSFTTDQGQEFPEGFQALTVPAQGLLTVNLGDQLRRRQSIATSITARTGRVVAWKTDVVTQPKSGTPLLGTPAGSQPLADPASPIPGITLALGVPEASTVWAWPEGTSGSGVNEQYVIYNPGLRTAQLQLSIALDAGAAEPFQLTVGPGQAVPVISNQEVRIPPGVGHAALLQSLNGVPVVAERTVSATSPSSWSGLGELPGAALTSTEWLIPAGRADQNHDGWVYVYNPRPVTVRGTFWGLTGHSRVPLQNFTIPAGKRTAIHLNALARIFDEPMAVVASAPVYAEADFYGIHGTPGLNLSLGIPLA
jgi:hypothetical protein